jgi:DNA-binding Lrp family transcriptional regulator
VIKSAAQYPVHALLNHETNVLYHVPPYQRECSWQRGEWEDLFDDLIEADGAHFLGTIITLNQTLDAADANVLELIDGQQRMTTLTLLMAAAFSILQEQKDQLDDDQKTDLTNLKWQLIHRASGEPRVRPQRQGQNLGDYHAVLTKAGLPIDVQPTNWMPSRRIDRCYNHFRKEITELAESEGLTPVEASTRVLTAAKQAIIVKIEVANHADAFVLFESLNNRGVPLTPVDLIKNHLLAQSERKKIMTVEAAFKRWNEMLTNLGDNYSNQERFLRQNYNAFKNDLPEVQRAPLATRANLIRIYETLVEADAENFLGQIIRASSDYGRITAVKSNETELDAAFRRLERIQGVPSYVLLLWLLGKRHDLPLEDEQLIAVTNLLSSFFVRRNLTGSPQTYALPRLFTGIIAKIRATPGDDIVETVRGELLSVSVSEDVFRQALLESIYDSDADVARFILATLPEDEMTKENRTDLWQREKNRYVWTIEHILPQGENLPPDWIEMLGGAGAAAAVQNEHVHRLGNLTITGYNSNLSNKSFPEKMTRKDSKGRSIGYENGLSLNSDVVGKTTWTEQEIEERTQSLAAKVVERFSLDT